MTITYTWKIIALDTIPILNNLTNVVTTAYWYLQGINGLNIASLQGCNKFNNTISNQGINPIPIPEYPNPSTFINFNLLTEDDVVSWIQDSLGEITINSLKSVIESQIQKQIQTNATALPWA